MLGICRLGHFNLKGSRRREKKPLSLSLSPLTRGEGIESEKRGYGFYWFALARAAGTLFLVALSLRASAQPSLQFFTNYANAALQAQFGFGVTNIPIYSPTNAAIGYSAPLHYVLQSAANAYDATTPSTNFGSVFRPMFSWGSNTLYIVGYAAVTNDFYSQTSTGFKDLTDPTISTDDNVWGIPWVIGMKNPVPSFHEYSYSSRVVASRRILFMRATIGGQPDTNIPPQYTNQFFIMSISNSFGMQLWNANVNPYTNNVTIVVSNRILLSLTNDYNWGTNMEIVSGGNWPTNFWPAWSGNPYSHTTNGSFQIPFSINSIFLPDSYWSESTGQFIQPTNGPSSPFFPEDMEQRNWPVHAWILNITNALMCALVDNQSGQTLDFVNLGEFGTSLDITNAIMSEPGLMGSNLADSWAIGNATDAPNSPMSTGMLNQIDYGDTSNTLYYNSLNGVRGNSSLPVYQGYVFGADYIPSNAMVQNCTWEAANPRVHYTLQDLTTPSFVDTVTPITSQIALSLPTTNAADSGTLTLPYNSGVISFASASLTNGMAQIQFAGATDLPYGIWASTNLVDWSEIGIANQLTPGNFQFTDTTVTNFPGRFYELRIP
jgi:hypothetical protein